MPTGKEYAKIVEQAYINKDGYIRGTAGKKWTQADQDALVKKYNSNPQKYADLEKGAKYGKKWIGKTVWDCSGLTSGAAKQLGLKYYHGSNSSWNKDCQKKGKITSGIKLPIGAWVYTDKNGDKSHIGTVTADGIVTEAQGTIYGVVQSKVTNAKWKYWGLGKGLEFDFVPGEAVNTTIQKTETIKKEIKNTTKKTVAKKHPTLRRGAKGTDVKEMQQLLKNYGSTLAVDGIFGAGTMSAIMGFQKKHGLVVDGIVGPKTWNALLQYAK